MAALVLTLTLKALPYSTSTFTWVDPEAAGRKPTPDFGLGPLVWRVTELKASTALTPFRESFHAACGSRSGLSAAACAAAELARRSPFGQPRDEFLDRSFDPQDHLRRHLGGEPGHCLTRSALLATQLLSVGVPARVVQMIPADGRGHTAVEVWDDCCGWTLVDPTFGGIVTSRPPPKSVAELQAAPESATWSGIPSSAFPPGGENERLQYVRGALKGQLIYPEPWLYLRLGNRVSPWTFRNHFVHIGPPDLWIGPAQGVLQATIPLTCVAGLGFLALGYYRGLVRDAAREGRRAVGGVPGSRVLRDADALPPI